jgi:hypothetical protein
VRIPVDHNPVTLPDLKAMFDLFAGVDGHPRGKADFEAWTTAATVGRWTRAQVAAAALAITTTFDGFRIMPGHIGHQTRNASRPPDRNSTHAGPLHDRRPRLPPADQAVHPLPVPGPVPHRRVLPRHLGLPHPRRHRCG